MHHRTGFFAPLMFSLLAIAFSVSPSAMTDFARQAPPATSTAKDFVGTWHWVFQGKTFSTMTLEAKADGVTGSITSASLHTDADGKITEAFAGTGICPIIRSSMKDGVLHVVCKDDDDEIEWAVKLTSPTTAEIVVDGADAPKMEPIRAEKAQ